MKADSKCTIGDRENTKVTSAYSGKAESARCVNAEDIFHQMDVYSLPFAEIGAKVTSKGRSSHKTACPT